jgi:hypothetical protein
MYLERSWRCSRSPSLSTTCSLSTMYRHVTKCTLKGPSAAAGLPTSQARVPCPTRTAMSQNVLGHVLALQQVSHPFKHMLILQARAPCPPRTGVSQNVLGQVLALKQVSSFSSTCFLSNAYRHVTKCTWTGPGAEAGLPASQARAPCLPGTGMLQKVPRQVLALKQVSQPLTHMLLVHHVLVCHQMYLDCSERCSRFPALQTRASFASACSFVHQVPARYKMYLDRSWR